jgi:hypothetical protein
VGYPHPGVALADGASQDLTPMDKSQLQSFLYKAFFGSGKFRYQHEASLYNLFMILGFGDVGKYYSVCQFYEDKSYEYICKNVPSEKAARVFYEHTEGMRIKLGVIRVILIDSGAWDCTMLDWQAGKGFTRDGIGSQTSHKSQREPRRSGALH